MTLYFLYGTQLFILIGDFQMAEYKLITALATDLPGNTMTCYGKLCNIKDDGVYIELTSAEAKVYLKAGRIAPLANIVDDPTPEPVKEPEPAVEEKKDAPPEPKAKEEAKKEAKKEVKTDKTVDDLSALLSGETEKRSTKK